VLLTCRKEIHRHARAHAFFIAEQENLFQLARLSLPTAKMISSTTCWRRMEGNSPWAELCRARRGRFQRARFGLFTQKAAQPDAIFRRLFQRLAIRMAALPGSHHHHVVRRGEFAADHSHPRARP